MNTSHRKLVFIAAILVVVIPGTLYLSAKPSFAPPNSTMAASIVPSASSAFPSESAVMPLLGSPTATAVPSPGTASSQPKISWSSTSIAPILSPGESTSSDLTFISSLPLSNIVIEPVSAIAPFVSIQPSSLANVPANQPQSIHIAVAIPANTALGTYEGTIHLRKGTSSYPATVKVVVKAWQTFTDSDLGATLRFPPTLFIVRPAERPDEVLIQNSDRRISLGGVTLDDSETNSGYIIGLSTTDYLKPFSIDTWLVDTYPHSSVGTITELQVSGYSGYRITFKDEIGAGEPIVVVPVGHRIVEISYASTFDPGSQQELDAMAVYNGVLTSVQLY